MDPKDNMESITLSANAVKRLKALLASDASKKALRIVVDTGGCYGFQYNFQMESDLQSDDLTFEVDGVTVAVDSISYDFIKGSEVDYVEELIGASFVIKNPKASSSCGCGSSFSV
jgi:iron-sulfur cluster assembly accessory protein